MANYYSVTKSNNFKTTDKEKLEEILNNTLCTDGDLELYENTDGTVCFAGETSIWGYTDDPDNEDIEPSFDKLCEKLQEVIGDDDFITITEVGHEKLCYLAGTMSIITKNAIFYIDLSEEGEKIIRKILGNDVEINW